ncbi:signal recognition particle 9 kDa protein-domain-containing protein [Exophiala viscosa]|uniref:Signal recognition particle 9 kDa protein-domain-containing protein n=1 Tax=Exophiala viscosa TaxID=2486360 RepID=A0AAN6DRG3_9EURO|nr:signal recognition particle 9 kDa protein-domain-containing protein [Exophiala viscosa]
MAYFSDLHTYLHQSSLLIQAYPSARITTKYSLPRKPNTKGRSKPREETAPSKTESGATQTKREPSAQLTLKTFEPESGICLKYRTDKAAEVGRLLAGLGRLAKGEIIEMPTAAAAANGSAAAFDGDKMDIDSGMSAPKVEDKVVTAAPAATQTNPAAGGGGGKNKKKKGKK